MRRDCLKSLTQAIALLLLPGAAAIVNGAPVETDFQSKWDEHLPGLEVHNVRVKPGDLVHAWQQMSTKYLLRANLCRDAISDSDSAIFSYNKDISSEAELLESFLSVYPAYTYTQDRQTGLIWIHRKEVNYEAILNQKVYIHHTVYQVPMYESVLLPICKMFSNLIDAPVYLHGSPAMVTYSYSVDLPAGEHSVRDILNYCCVADPAKAFYIKRDTKGRLLITPTNLRYDDPLTPPRTAELAFWEMEIGTARNLVPSLEEIGSALSDPDPKRRIAARFYLNSTSINYNEEDLLNSSNTEEAIWAALGLKSIDTKGVGNLPYLTRMTWITSALTNHLVSLDPCLALLASMEIAVEQNDVNCMHAVAAHKFSASECASIKHDIIRIARRSKLVRDQLSKMVFDDPELSAKALQQLDDPNLFTLVPIEKH